LNKNIGIYIHIPFCERKCHYCDFISFENKEEDCISKYIDAVCNEILQKADILSEYNINTIYFGGGTPSYIDSKYIEKILNVLKLFEDTNNGNIMFEENIEKEITIEVNPGTVTQEKINCYKQNGINRISIGLQTTHDFLLKKIGRIHTFDDFKNTLIMCKKANIENISVDLMYPLPELTLDLFKKSVNEILLLKDEYNIKHISIYNLEIHSGTKLDFLIKEKYLTLPDEEQEYEMKLFLEDTLVESGFYKYEISNFAIPGYESKHNVNYWNQGIYLGFGIAAASFILSTRYKNGFKIEEYIKNISSGISYEVEKEEMDKLDLMREYIILKLRLKSGINSNEFESIFKSDIFNIFAQEFEILKNQELVNIIKNNNISDKNSLNISLTKRGFEVANIVFAKFVE